MIKLKLFESIGDFNLFVKDNSIKREDIININVRDLNKGYITLLYEYHPKDEPKRNTLTIKDIIRTYCSDTTKQKFWQCHGFALNINGEIYSECQYCDLLSFYYTRAHKVVHPIFSISPDILDLEIECINFDIDFCEEYEGIVVIVIKTKGV